MPETPWADYQAGLNHTAVGELALARTDFQQSIQKDPGWPFPYYRLGAVLESMDREPEAKEAMQKYLDILDSRYRESKSAIHARKVVSGQ